jgi:hypothetical protein
MYSFISGACILFYRISRHIALTQNSYFGFKTSFRCSSYSCVRLRFGTRFSTELYHLRERPKASLDSQNSRAIFTTKYLDGQPDEDFVANRKRNIDLFVLDWEFIFDRLFGIGSREIMLD